MLIIFSLVILIIIGIFLLFLYERLYWDNINLIGMFITSFGIICLIVCSIYIFSVQVSSNLDYENMLAKKQMIEYRLEKQNDIVGNELLYSQIIEFNNELRSVKKWANNSWTNWFNNQKIANNIDYVNIK